MFDIGATELLVIAIVAILVIGPKDLPLAMRTAGRWIGKFRRMTGHFRTGIDAMVREAEMEDMERKWREQNARIMAKYPDDAGSGSDAGANPPSAAEARAAHAGQTAGKDDAKRAEGADPASEPDASYPAKERG